jgi:hypothetical protein
MIYNNIKKCHHNKRNLPNSRFQRKFTFQTISATRKKIRSNGYKFAREEGANSPR